MLCIYSDVHTFLSPLKKMHTTLIEGREKKTMT